MTVTSFKIGDRVRSSRTAVVSEGTQGTVQGVSLTIPNAYLVLFDRWPTPQLIHARDLVLVLPSAKP